MAFPFPAAASSSKSWSSGTARSPGRAQVADAQQQALELQPAVAVDLHGLGHLFAQVVLAQRAEGLVARAGARELDQAIAHEIADQVDQLLGALALAEALRQLEQVALVGRR